MERKFNVNAAYSFSVHSEPVTINQLGNHLEQIIGKIKALRKKEAKINDRYVIAKNSLAGYAMLWGKEALKHLGAPMEEFEKMHISEFYRDDYFENIKYRSKLRKVRDRMKILENEYGTTLEKIKSLK